MVLTLHGFCTPRVAAESLNGVKHDCKSANSESTRLIANYTSDILG